MTYSREGAGEPPNTHNACTRCEATQNKRRVFVLCRCGSLASRQTTMRERVHGWAETGELPPPKKNTHGLLNERARSFHMFHMMGAWRSRRKNSALTCYSRFDIIWRAADRCMREHVCDMAVLKWRAAERSVGAHEK